MSKKTQTLIYTDSITRTGYTEIDGVKVMQHTCVINTDDPEKIRINSVQLNKELYKANRDTCRADIAEFEDAAYELQETYLNKEGSEA